MLHRKRHRRSGKTKSSSMQLHAQRRANERFGFVPSRKQYAEMCRMCSSGEYFCYLERQSSNRSKAVILFEGMLIPVIYDKKRKQIATVLSQSMLSPDEVSIVQQEIERRQNNGGI